MLLASGIVLLKAQKRAYIKLRRLIMGKILLNWERYYGTNVLVFCPNVPTSYANGRNRCSRSELVSTDTELRAMAPAASMGESSQPVAGYSKPAATGIPITL